MKKSILQLEEPGRKKVPVQCKDAKSYEKLNNRDLWTIDYANVLLLYAFFVISQEINREISQSKGLVTMGILL